MMRTRCVIGSAARRDTAHRGGSSADRAPVLLRFALGSAAAITVAVSWRLSRAPLRRDRRGEARARGRRCTRPGQLVEATLGRRLAYGQAAPQWRAVDDVVVARVLSSSIVRVKIWSADGRVLYSDDAGADRRPLRARRRPAAAAARRRRRKWRSATSSRPENALDRGHRQADRGVHADPDVRPGRRCLFEIYQRFGSVTASARRLLGALAPPILGAIGLLLLVQVPLLWSLARRLQRGYEERETLLENAIAASARERRRVASYLHDGAGPGHRRSRLLARAAGRRADGAAAASCRGDVLRHDDRAAAAHRP